MQQMTMPPLTVAIQAGGESRRMGRSKATVPFLGHPLIERIVTRVAPVADEVLITTNEPDNLAFLQDHPAWGKVRLVRDRFEERGSLAGLATALTEATNDYVSAVACDMVFADARLIRANYQTLLAHPEADLVVPRLAKGFEPFYGVYRRQACLERALATLATGEKRIRVFLEGARKVEVSPEQVARIVPEGMAFVNTNTPQELARAEEVALKQEDARA